MNSTTHTFNNSRAQTRQPKLFDGAKTRVAQASHAQTRLLNAVHSNHHSPLPPSDGLGLALIEEGAVTLEDVRQHLTDSEGNPGFIQLLLHCPMVSEEELASLLAARYRVPVLNLDAMKVPPSVVRLLSADAALGLECLPVARIGKLVCVALADIRDREKIRNVRAALGGAKVKVFPTPREMLQRHLTSYYYDAPTIEEVRPLPQAAPAKTEAPRAVPVAVRTSEPAPAARAEKRTQDEERAGQNRSDVNGASNSRQPETPSAGKEAALLPEGAEVIHVGAPVAQDKEDASTSAEPADAGGAESLSDKLHRLNASEGPLTEDELEELLTAMAEDAETSDDSFLAKADEVSEADYQTSLDCAEEAFLKRWERTHFSHSPVRAEPAVLGFPDS